MRLFVLVYFWLGVLVFILRVFFMAFVTWPRERSPESLGAYLASTLETVAFTTWAGIVLWVVL